MRSPVSQCTYYTLEVVDLIEHSDFMSGSNDVRRTEVLASEASRKSNYPKGEKPVLTKMKYCVVNNSLSC